jgi:hypothetical protein
VLVADPASAAVGEVAGFPGGICLGFEDAGAREVEVGIAVARVFAKAVGLAELVRLELGVDGRGGVLGAERAGIL